MLIAALVLALIAFIAFVNYILSAATWSLTLLLPVRVWCSFSWIGTKSPSVSVEEFDVRCKLSSVCIDPAITGEYFGRKAQLAC